MPEEENHPEESITPSPTSHVTAAPESIPGQSYDPRLRAQYANEPHVVHADRPVEVEKRPLSEDMQRRCAQSRQRYPHLSLSDGEFVILDIKRHPIGLFMPIAATGLIILVLIVLLIFYPSDASGLGLPEYNVILWPALLFMGLVGMGGFVAIWVYLQNQFYLTNESVMQGIQTGLFSRHEQTVSLGSIEDASFKQNGIFQTMLNYGTIRLSTEGEETTYRFSYVANPRQQVAIVNDAIENFKNGRPVDPYET